ncbi:hypothetical protein TNCV_1413141 [Trichonephila clavipes]|nr:hypothetical protein TNCV_1413141 [Trichonephila clavipes]
MLASLVRLSPPHCPRCIKLPVNRHLDWNEVALSPNMSFYPSSMSLDLSSMSLDLSSMSFGDDPLSQSSLWGGMKNFLSALKNIFVRNLKNFALFISYDPSSISLDQSSMSFDPRVKTVFGRPLFHLTSQEFHLWMTSV